MQELILVNASPVLMDDQVRALVKPMQTQIDRDFLPAWEPYGVKPVKVVFASVSDIPHLPPASWPVFHNRHSVDPGALGWHDFNHERAMSRVFVGDCIRLSLEWRTTSGHEVLELMVDPDVQRVYRMADGELAALEVCDAVEADDQAYEIDGHPMTNFVLPAYFSRRKEGPFDFRGVLTHPCPALSPGGYMSVTQGGRWTQVTMDRHDGLIGRRAMVRGFRRQVRAARPVSDLSVFEDDGA